MLDVEVLCFENTYFRKPAEMYVNIICFSLSTLSKTWIDYNLDISFLNVKNLKVCMVCDNDLL